VNGKGIKFNIPLGNQPIFGGKLNNSMIRSLKCRDGWNIRRYRNVTSRILIHLGNQFPQRTDALHLWLSQCIRWFHCIAYPCLYQFVQQLSCQILFLYLYFTKAMCKETYIMYKQLSHIFNLVSNTFLQSLTQNTLTPSISGMI
jgi:hypothetical protein